jgi:serine/threonine-protein kinase
MDAESDDTVSAPEPHSSKSEPHEDQTAVVARRESEPELAWSADGPDYTQHWALNGMSPEQARSTATWIAYAAIATAVAAFVGVVAFWWGQHQRTEGAGPNRTPQSLTANQAAPSNPAAPPQAVAPHTPTAVPTVTATIRYALPACYWQTDPPSERPTTVTFQACADAGLRLESMSWSSWGAGGAQGTGILTFRVCEPDCADGHNEQYAVNVSAFEPRPAPFDSRCPTDVMFYSEMVVAFRASAPNSTEMAADTTYLGRPAIRFSTAPGVPDRDALGRQLCM